MCFAMNADQCGSSDLDAAYVLRRALPAWVDLRICQHELGVNGVVRLLEAMDAVVAMRFHAAIFALSRNLPTVGIDYQLPKHGKVWELMSERGLGGQVANISELSADWLCQQLRQITRAARAAA